MPWFGTFTRCRSSTFAEGVLLIGAAHLASLTEAIEKHIKSEPDPVDWNIPKELR